MKPVQVMLDESLLKRLAQSEEVRERGRSQVIRQAVFEYLARRENEEIARRYREAYGDRRDLAHELDGWGEEGEWPPE
ncbi:MAG: ribbon-helix-helix protein, CopG family [Spirochaetota bacterium]